MIKPLKTILLSFGIALISNSSIWADNTAKTLTSTQRSILLTYAKIANANYTDALNDAKALQRAVKAFTENPDKITLDYAKAAWLIARESFDQSEIFRLSNGPIDAKEGWVAQTYGALDEQINAWPLDENMIDYTIDAHGKRTTGNIIDSKGPFKPGGEDAKAVDVSTITVASITALNENGGDANVATGYHAVEFLLWGQDQDYANFIKDAVTHGPLTAGERPLSDYTTDKNAERRKAYLNAAAAKIVADLEVVSSAWREGGEYRNAFLGKAKESSRNIPVKLALKQIFTGMGVFIKSEVANERIAIAVLTPSEEDEQSCFSDNTHRDIAMNYQGFKNILMGTYNGMYYGKAPIDAMKDEARTELLTLMSKIEHKIALMNALAETSRHFDYQVHPNDPQARKIVKLKNYLRKLGDKMVYVAAANGIDFSTEDVTDAKETQI